MRSPLGQAIRDLPAGALQRLPVDECQRMARQLSDAFDAKKGQLRALTPEEQVFITNERFLTKIDFQYCAERYCYIIHPAKGLAPLFPLFESQRLILQAIGKVEATRFATQHPDGLICNVLKGRQLGASTLVQAMLAHRLVTQTYTTGLIASDVPENSGSAGLFGKLELTVEHMPWWLKPAERFHTKNQGITWTNHSSIVVESGKSMKGGLQDEGGTKGQMGRSKTYQVAHLSECSTWENPGQIDDALMPAIPATPRTLMVKESTAKGRHNWWHKEWQATERGVGRSFNIFIPWYAERSKYTAPPPTNWSPDAETLKYAARVTSHSAKWMGRPFSLDPGQLYWYYSQRQYALEKGQLYKFLEEFPAEPEEAFQYSGRSIFTPAEIDRIRTHARPIRALYRVLPGSLIAELRDTELDARELAIEASEGR